MEHSSAERAAFLSRACGADAELRREVEQMLAACDTAGDFLEAGHARMAAEILGPDSSAFSISPTLETGQTLDHYQIISLLGKGGMGEVYSALDQRLHRKVALKVLLAGDGHDRNRVRRFEQEARAALALNHPNIAMIFDVGRTERGHFIAMELVEGQTLRAVLREGKHSLTAAIEITLQVAQALAAAHQAGVIHRDIKPENLMRRPDGYIKVLDFGLAKLIEARNEAEKNAQSSALHAPHSGTARGTVMGTVSYMSPEQARGQEVDARTDLFSLGVVLFELTTGQLPFSGETPSDVLAAILKSEPPALEKLLPSAPAQLQRILALALRKNRDERYRTAGELLHDLRELKRDLEWDSEHRASSKLSDPAAAGTGDGNAGTGQINTIRTQSGTEYVVDRIRRHKLAVSLAGTALILAALIFFFIQRNVRTSEPGITSIKSLVVLPLANVSGAPEQEYFSDGLTEALITDLASVGALRVISRTSSMQYKGARKSLSQVTRELNVEAVLEGSVIRVGDRVRITVQLIHAPSEAPLWAHSYERDVRDVLALQREVVRDIVANIKSKLTPAEQLHLANARPVNPAAYEAYLQGRYHWNKRTAQGLDMAIVYFQDSLRLAPDHAAAYAGLADSYLLLTPYRNVPAGQSYPKAKDAAQQALKLDPSLAAAHAALAVVKHEYDWDWSGAEQSFQRAIELNPNHATAHQWYAELLMRLRRKTEARAEIERALALDPLSLIVNSVNGWVYLNSNELDSAAEQLRKTLELDARFVPAHGYLGLVYQYQGQYAQALAEFRLAHELSGGNPRYLANLGVVQALSGRPDAARQTLDELLRLNARQRVHPFHLAGLYTALEDREQAFARLEQAYSERGVWMLFLHLDPLFERLRPDARFANLLLRVGLSSG